jgi:hypothetical protein
VTFDVSAVGLVGAPLQAWFLHRLPPVEEVGRERDLLIDDGIAFVASLDEVGEQLLGITASCSCGNPPSPVLACRRINTVGRGRRRPPAGTVGRRGGCGRGCGCGCGCCQRGSSASPLSQPRREGPTLRRSTKLGCSRGHPAGNPKSPSTDIRRSRSRPQMACRHCPAAHMGHWVSTYWTSQREWS